MKKSIVLFSASLLMASQFSFGTPINERQDNQENRITQGVISGELTQVEANRLNRQQTHIDVREAQFRADGEFTARERASIQHKQNQASKNIFVQKHDAQDRN